MSKRANTTISSSSKTQNKSLVTITPGAYFKLSENERTMIKEPTSGILISSFINERTGESVYNVALVDGELLLISTEDPCLVDLEK